MPAGSAGKRVAGSMSIKMLEKSLFVMSKVTEQIHCQRCLKVNPLGQEFCARCNTRLMLVVEPSTLRHEETTNAVYDEHLLERVSALENRLSKIAERLGQGLDLLLRQTRTSHMQLLLLETLLGALSETGHVDQKKVIELWRERCEQESEAGTAQIAEEGLREQIVTQYKGGEKVFVRLINAGFDLVSEGKTVRAIRTLERAAALAPDNAPLNFYLGTHFFREGKTTLARDYLARAFESEPKNPCICLLLGLACADEGDAAQGESLLREAIRRHGPSFAAHYALGRLAIAAENFTEALAEFKHALAARACPEAHYNIGLIYFQLKRNHMSIRHLRAATRLDPKYGEAFYALGLIFAHSGKPKQAGEAFSRAFDVSDDTARGQRARSVSPCATLRQLLVGSNACRKRRFLTGNDKRAATLVREDALSTAARTLTLTIRQI